MHGLHIAQLRPPCCKELNYCGPHPPLPQPSTLDFHGHDLDGDLPIYIASAHQMLHFSTAYSSSWPSAQVGSCQSSGGSPLLWQFEMLHTYVLGHQARFASSHPRQLWCWRSQVNSTKSLISRVSSITDNCLTPAGIEVLMPWLTLRKSPSCFTTFPSGPSEPLCLGYRLTCDLARMLPSSSLPGWGLLPCRVVGVYDIRAYFLSTLDI